VAWSSLEAPLVTIGGLWPGYVSQAHHGVAPPGYGHEFLRDAAQMEKGQVYSYVMANNFRTNFSPVQVADCLFRYSLTSYRGDWREGDAVRSGWSVANPLLPVCVVGPQEGGLPLKASFGSVEPKNVLVLTLKGAEDGDGVIVRLVETEGQACTTRVELPYYDIEQAFLTDLVEEDRSALGHDRHSVVVPIGAYGLATVRCRGRRLPAPGHYAYY
jgi:alpha-mannosidase